MGVAPGQFLSLAGWGPLENLFIFPHPMWGVPDVEDSVWCRRYVSWWDSYDDDRDDVLRETLEAHLNHTWWVSWNWRGIERARFVGGFQTRPALPRLPSFQSTFKTLIGSNEANFKNIWDIPVGGDTRVEWQVLPKQLVIHQLFNITLNGCASSSTESLADWSQLKLEF